MVRDSDIIRQHLGKADMRLVIENARKASIGGRSEVRGADRKARLTEDQIVGQIGQYVGSKWMFGTIQPYMVTRWYANRYPTHGDGGSDIPAGNVDFKASLRRNANLPLLNHCLPMRPRERHEGWVYILVLVDVESRTSATAHMVVFLAVA